MSEHDDLKKWLRENSSGVYRQAAEAADVIEGLENQVGNYEELMAQLEEVVVFPETDDQEWQLRTLKGILGLTPSVVCERRLRAQPEG
jgi:hypothetical protein